MQIALRKPFLFSLYDYILALEVQFVQQEYSISEDAIRIILTLQANESADESFSLMLNFSGITAGGYVIERNNIMYTLFYTLL